MVVGMLRPMSMRMGVRMSVKVAVCMAVRMGPQVCMRPCAAVFHLRRGSRMG